MTTASVYGWKECFALLQRCGFAPRNILDVGANHGHWTRAAVPFFPQARYVLVEPQAGLEAGIQDLIAHGLQVKWITAGVSDAAGDLPLTIAPDDVSSNFLLTPAEAAALGLRQTRVPLRTLNDIVAAEFSAVPEMVKVDAEGFDLKALAGGTSLLGTTEVFFLEAAVCAPGLENTLAAVVGFMAEAGYKVIDMVDLNRSPADQVLWLCELVFLREDSPLLGKVKSYR